MNILVINAGSSSFKFKLIDMNTEESLANGSIERIGTENSIFFYSGGLSKKKEYEGKIDDHVAAVKMAIEMIVDKDYGVIDSVAEICAVGHRVSNGGEKFSKCALVNDSVIEAIKDYSSLSPLHNPHNLAGILACKELMPDTPMTVLFDTAFHSTMPEEAYLCPLPYEWYEKYHVRNYGFHGISHQYVSESARQLAGNKATHKMVICHLGNGSSITALIDGKSVDNSMSFTPLSGIPMGTRSGDIDPTILTYMSKKLNTDCQMIMADLNKKSGLLGLSGLSSDLRDIIAAALNENKRAACTIKVLIYRIKKYIGAYAAILNGLDCLVFTAGIGENSPLIRELICTGMDYLGIALDHHKNKSINKSSEGFIISQDKSKVRVLVIPTNEELTIARETKKLINRSAAEISQ